MTSQPRRPAGNTSGGQFAATVRPEAVVTLGYPVDGAQQKRLRQHPWDATSDVTVYVKEREGGYRRCIDVFDADGQPLGSIESGMARSERKIAGSRLVSRGNDKTVWYSREPGGDISYWDDQPSQSAAIRQLLARASRAG